MSFIVKRNHGTTRSADSSATVRLAKAKVVCLKKAFLCSIIYNRVKGIICPTSIGQNTIVAVKPGRSEITRLSANNDDCEHFGFDNPYVSFTWRPIVSLVIIADSYHSLNVQSFIQIDINFSIVNTWLQPLEKRDNGSFGCFCFSFDQD